MPEVRLGELAEGGLAPAIMAEGYPPVRIAFGEDEVLVEDGAARPGCSPRGGSGSRAGSG